MSDAAMHGPRHAKTQEELEETPRLGIARVPVDWFHFREFRYTNLKDSIAEAKRQEARDLVARDWPDANAGQDRLH